MAAATAVTVALPARQVPPRFDCSAQLRVGKKATSGRAGRAVFLATSSDKNMAYPCRCLLLRSPFVNRSFPCSDDFLVVCWQWGHSSVPYPVDPPAQAPPPSAPGGDGDVLMILNRSTH